MKRLTMNQVAKANLKHNKKAYFSLAIGIFLAVYLACTAVLCIYGTLEAKNEQAAHKVGWADTMIISQPSVTDDQLRTSGLFDQIGHIYVTASVGETDVFVGYYDETADELMYRQCVTGRLPEKAGEIAAEQSALDKLGLENAQVGDTFSWEMLPFQGKAETRTYTLVGILSEQTGYLDVSNWFVSGAGTNMLPAILTAMEEPAFPVGTPTVHRVMTNIPLISHDDVEKRLNNEERMVTVHSISRVYGRSYPYDMSESEAEARFAEVVLYLLLGGALLLSTCVAIASAMESMLAQKTEDIGMLRAVGATKKQIKRLFGRDSWIISLASLPLGVVLGCLTCYLLSLAMPGDLLFRPVPWLILPVVAISFLCVFLSSSMPLRRASRQLPMGVLRDTDTLRKAKKFRSQKHFKATQLIASRQFRLHPMRQAGSACMVALMLVISVLLGEMLLSMDWSAFGNQEAFYLSGDNRTTIVYEPFAQVQEDNVGLTQNDMDQLRSLPMIGKVNTRLKTGAILMLPDEIPTYFKTQMLPITYEDGYVMNMDINAWGGNVNTAYLDVTEDTTEADFADEFEYNTAMYPYIQMRMLQKVLGIQNKFVPIDIIVTSLDGVDFSDVIMEGDIDLAALDAGREVLVFAPNMYAKHYGDGAVTQSNSIRDDKMEQWDIAIYSDYFHPGQEVPIIQLFGKMPDWFNHRTDEGQLERYYGGLEQTSFTPKVGAVLKSDFRLGNTRPFGLCIITTEQGAKALGLKSNGAESVSIFLSGDPDIATEELLANNIRRISMRRDLEFTNNLADNRETKTYQIQLLSLFVGMVLLFFAVAVSMQVTNASRRIRADERMVGTLRAVGADENALLSCYRLPIIISSLCGFVLAAIFYLLMMVFYPIAFPEWHIWLLAIVLIMAGLNAVCSIMGVRGQLHRVVNKSIIENIREL